MAVLGAPLLAGAEELTRETDVFAYVNANHRPGDQLKVTFLRDGRRLTGRIPVQK